MASNRIASNRSLLPMGKIEFVRPITGLLQGEEVIPMLMIWAETSSDANPVLIAIPGTTAGPYALEASVAYATAQKSNVL